MKNLTHCRRIFHSKIHSLEDEIVQIMFLAKVHLAGASVSHDLADDCSIPKLCSGTAATSSLEMRGSRELRRHFSQCRGGEYYS